MPSSVYTGIVVDAFFQTTKCRWPAYTSVSVALAMPTSSILKCYRASHASTDIVESHLSPGLTVSGLFSASGGTSAGEQGGTSILGLFFFVSALFC